MKTMGIGQPLSQGLEVITKGMNFKGEREEAPYFSVNPKERWRRIEREMEELCSLTNQRENYSNM